MPNRDDLAAFVPFATAFEADGFVPGTWHAPEEIEPGVFEVGWWEMSADVERWHEALYEHDITDPKSDYMSEACSTLMGELQKGPGLLADADLPTVRSVLTNIVRGERFCDGYMAGMFEAGVAQAATRRLAQLSTQQG